MKNIFFTSDHHFGHKGVIKHSKRPFLSVEEMDETMILRWNEKVRPNDIVYHLGDFAQTSFKETENILSRLHGKIHLIQGNHDKWNKNCIDKFEWIKDYHELKLPEAGFANNRLLVLMHYPLLTWEGKYSGAYHLFGHSHGQLSIGKRSKALDVGVDCHNFYPLSYEEVKTIINAKSTP